MPFFGCGIQKHLTLTAVPLAHLFWYLYKNNKIDVILCFSKADD
jgi:hypothetical protein